MTDKITIERQTLQAALEWMESAWHRIDGEWGPSGKTLDQECSDGDEPEIAALRAALAAQPAEPVADMVVGGTQVFGSAALITPRSNAQTLPHGKYALYAAPPAPAALTDDDMLDIWVSLDGQTDRVYRFGREVERAHGIAAAGEKT